jgi:homoserine dehydrogenase
MADDPKTSVIGIGILGCGNVGGALVNLLQERADDISERTSTLFEVRKVAVRSPSKDRTAQLPREILTDDANAVVSDPDVDIVVELIGGIEPARSLITKALTLGKPVVTANKELMANVGLELAAIAEANHVDLLYEAAVGGGIPIIRPLRESLAGESIQRIVGIVNGTTNYILTRMTEEGAEYAEALVEAQGHGYAERDPTADVEGLDAAAKAAILANVAFGARIVAGDVYSEGISTVTQDDIGLAARLGYTVKLLAVVEHGPKNRVGVRVHPTMVPINHPLASVRLSFNALFIEGDGIGELMFYGRGAGGAPTASAVLGDLIDAAYNKSTGVSGRMPKPGSATLWPIDEQSSAFYVTVDVADRPGVLSVVAGVLGNHDVSIRSMEQLGLGNEARLIFITHVALEGDVRAMLHDLRSLDSVRRVGNVMRVIES